MYPGEECSVTARGELKIEDPAKPRRPRAHLVSGVSRRRIWVRRVGVLMVVLVLWLAWSIGGALTAPGTDTTSARPVSYTHLTLPTNREV